ncbi:MAG: hypothetical protein ABJC09_09925 [Terriglobia bacterium]
MKSFQTKTTTALLILAASAIPALSQERGRDRGGDRAFQRSERQQQQPRSFQPQSSQGRSQMQSRPAAQDFQSQQQATQNRAGSFQSSPQFQRQGNSQQRQNYQQPQTFQQQSPQQNYRQQNYGQQNYRQQNYGQQNYRPDARSYRDENLRNQQYRSGNSYGGYNSLGWQNGGRNWSTRGGYRGYVIPQTRFYSSFGRNHFFRIGRPQFYGGYPRFQYGGYMFRFVDSYPSIWGSNWYDTDNVYIDYEDGGYYLYDSQYPDEGVPVEIEN